MVAHSKNCLHQGLGFYNSEGKGHSLIRSQPLKDDIPGILVPKMYKKGFSYQLRFKAGITKMGINVLASNSTETQL